MATTNHSDTSELYQWFSRLNIGHVPSALAHDAPTSDSASSAIMSDQITGQVAAPDHKFEPQIELPDVSRLFASLQLTETGTHNDKDNGNFMSSRRPSPSLKKSDWLPPRHRQPDRRSRVTGLSGGISPSMLRQGRPGSGSSSGARSSSLPSLSSSGIEAHTRWDFSRRARNPRCGWPEQWWLRSLKAKRKSKTEVGIENTRRSHREAQRAAQRNRKGKEKVTEAVDGWGQGNEGDKSIEGNESDDEIL